MGNFDDDIIARDQRVSDLESLRFFQTQPHVCSYLPEKMATTVFLSPEQKISTPIYTQLSDFGFRRSGDHTYKPMCKECDACIPLRIPAADFKPNRSQKRILKRNLDLSVRVVRTIDTVEHYQLYQEYIEQRHKDGDMYPPSREQYRSFLTADWPSCIYFEFRQQGKLMAVSVADLMDNGISAIYSFYDPAQDKRSLGTYIILFLIRQALKTNLASVYLGYWIKNSPKMSYKSAFRPMEIFYQDRWLRVN